MLAISDADAQQNDSEQKNQNGGQTLFHTKYPIHCNIDNTEKETISYRREIASFSLDTKKGHHPRVMSLAGVKRVYTNNQKHRQKGYLFPL